MPVKLSSGNIVSNGGGLLVSYLALRTVIW